MIAQKPIVPSLRPDGTLMCLASVTASDISFAEMASGLSKITRWNGRYLGPPYYVAQHCVTGADALFAETGDVVLAGYFLLHDGHEYLLGDWTRPAVDAVELAAVKELRTAGKGKPVVRDARERVKSRTDLAIWEAAKLPRLDKMPLYNRQVADMDERMLRAEGLALFGPQAAAHLPAADLPAPRLTGSLKPWGPMKAEEAFCERLGRYLGIETRAQ